MSGIKPKHVVPAAPEVPVSTLRELRLKIEQLEDELITAREEIMSLKEEIAAWDHDQNIPKDNPTDDLLS